MINKNFVYYPFIILIGICGVLPPLLGYLNPDSAWPVSVADRVVNGGEKLGVDVYETNPPLVVYINYPAVWLSNLTGLFLPHALVLYVATLALISLSMAFITIKNWWNRIALVFGLVFFAGINFTQREHFMLILILPYFISVIKDERHGLLYTISAGLVAGLGFALKPYYVLLFGGIVLGDMYYRKKFWIWLELKHLLTGLVILAYVFFLFFVEKNYVHNVLSPVLKYYSAFNRSWLVVIQESFNAMLFAQISFIVVMLKARNLISKEIYFTALANILAVICVILQRKAFSNHFYPAYFFCIWMNALIMYKLWFDVRPLWHKIIMILSTFIMVVFLASGVVGAVRMANKSISSATNETLQLLKTHADGKNVYVISFDMGTSFPAILYSNSVFKSRYSQLWMLLGMYEDLPKIDGEAAYRMPGTRIDDETRVIATILSELAHNPPSLVMVAKRDYNTVKLGNVKFDFISYLSLEPDFRKIWKNYKLIKTSNDIEYYIYKPDE